MSAAESPPAEGRTETREGAEGWTGDAVRSYLREIAAYPLLSREDQRELFERLVREREAVQEAALSLRETAEALVRRWAERVRMGLATGMLSAHYFDAGRRDFSPEVDRNLGQVAELLRQAAGTRSHGGDPTAHLEARIALPLRAANLSFETVMCAFQEGARAAELQADTARAALFARVRAAIAAFQATRRVAVESNLRLVVGFARQYARRGVDVADLIQQGNLALIRAVEKFDPARGLMFSTYAVWWLRQGMIRAIQRQSRTVQPPSTAFGPLVRFRRAEVSLRTRSPTEPRISDIVREAGLSEVDCCRVMAALSPIASTHTSLGNFEGLTLEDTFADETTPDAGSEFDRRSFIRAVPQLLDRLSSRERFVVEAHFGLNGDEAQSLAEIGEFLGLCRERVRQIEAAALKRLRSLELSRPLPMPTTSRVC